MKGFYYQISWQLDSEMKHIYCKNANLITVLKKLKAQYPNTKFYIHPANEL